MEKETISGLVAAGIVFIIIFSITVFFSLRDRDRGEEIIEDEYQEPIFDEIGLEIEESFFIDRLATYTIPPEDGQQWLVMWVNITNPQNRNITLYTHLLNLVTDSYVYEHSPSDTTGLQIEREQNMTPLSSLSGYLIYSIVPQEKLIKLVYNESLFNLTLDKNLTGLKPYNKTWETPLQFRITGCGRDEPGSGKEQFLHFFLEVVNPTINGTQFQSWKIDLICWNDVKLDGLFVDRPTGDFRFHPGWNVTYKVYFDIPPGSPDLPKALFQKGEGMYLVVDGSLYEGLI